MLKRLATFTVRRHRPILILALIGFVVAGALGAGVAGKLSAGGFDDPDSASSRAEALLDKHFDTGPPNLVLLVTADEGRSVDDPEVAAAATALTERLAADRDMDDVMSYWSMGRPAPLRSSDQAERNSALIVGRITGDQNHVVTRGAEMRDLFGGPITGAHVTTGGFAPVFADVNHTVESDLIRAELIALPLTLILLLLIFRGLVASLLPLAIGGLAIVGTFVVLSVLTGFTDVSIFALNLTTAMSLGLAIDYSLFVISRYREELAAGHHPDRAVVRTVQTAGRTVAFSALTVAVSLSALLVFPQPFLRSFAYAGIAVATLCGLFALVVLPAMLAALGHRIDAWSVRHRPTPPLGQGLWHRLAVAVMARPIPIILGVVVILLLLGSPFLHLSLGRPDDRVLPREVESRQVSETLRADYTSQEVGSLSVVLTGLPPGERAAALSEFAIEVSRLERVARVDAETGIYLAGTEVPVGEDLTGRFATPSGAAEGSADTAWMSVVPAVEPLSPEGEALVAELRAIDTPLDVLVTGEAAHLVDAKASIADRLPLALGIVAVVTIVLLFLMFGSVVVPIKALILNLLSLTATFGAMVWVFQDGNWSGVLDFTATGTLDGTVPILMFCVAFGLAMDYEVFLLSRIKEEHDAGRDNISAVAIGLERTGRIVTAAALLISMVFLAFATSQVSFIKLFGLGLALAVLIDTFVIRATLVPAFMRLAGEANWWAPRWMRPIHERLGFAEHVDLEAAEKLVRAPR